MAQILSNLSVGTKIKLGKHQVNTETAQPIIWVVADKNHSGYPSNSVTLIAEKSIDLRMYDAAETDNSSGNRNYALSNINQWLNSSASAGNWYTATHAKDNPPSGGYAPYANRAGFLYNFTEYERQLLLPTTLTIQDGSDTSTKIVASVYLPSAREILGTGEVSDGSTRLSYFSSNTTKCVVTDQAFNNTLANSKPSAVTGYWAYWTRSNMQNYTCLIDMDGTAKYDSPVNIRGVRPVVNLSSTTKISNSTDSDGCYTLVVNKLPTISGTNSNIGIKNDDFSVSYSITDGDNEAVTVTEYIDNVKVRSYVATLGATNNFNVNGNTWLKLANGSHTLKIEATDGYDTDTRTHTFTKSVNKLIVKRTTPIEASKMPTQIVVTVVKTIPYNAIMTVEVCNNGYDTNPTWEQIDKSSISSGLAYEFKNKVKTASKWGVNIRVTVDRNGGEGACYITEIGGNFE